MSVRKSNKSIKPIKPGRSGKKPPSGKGKPGIDAVASPSGTSPVPSHALTPGSVARHWEGTVGPLGADRADRYIAEVLGLLSRSQIKSRGAVLRLGGREIKLSRALPADGALAVDWMEEPVSGLVAEDIPLSILYEDANVIVVDKAQGMVTHPGHGNRRGTLANALAGRFRARPESSSVSTSPSDPVPVNPEENLRGSIVHRLDKDTSGVIIAAKNPETRGFLAAQFANRGVRKEYIAITRGIPSETSGKIENRLARDSKDRKRFCVADSDSIASGRLSVTEYKVLASWKAGPGGFRYALVSMRPKTGRTHQLRVHMQHLGCPILGDPLYGRVDAFFPEASLMLHAFRLHILLPGMAEPSVFRASVPDRFRKIVKVLQEQRA